MTIISVKNLVKRFENVTAVDGISFEIEEGKITGLLGPNGAGKTTTIQMLLDIISPTSGEIKIFGKDLHKNREEIFEELVTKSIIKKSDSKIVFCKICDYVSIIPINKSICKDKILGYELYYIPHEDILKTWKGSPSTFLEAVCYGILSNKYAARLNYNIFIYPGKVGDTGNGKNITELEFLVDNTIVVLCSTNPKDPDEKRQVKIAKEKLGYKVLFVTTEDSIGEMKPDDKIVLALENQNLERELIKKVEDLLA